MSVVGIIAEYNPFHNGHLYQLEESKKLAGSDAVVVAMSGNFVQRGEPAIFDKWERAKFAVMNGADLVIEIPTIFCLGNASQYAKGGIGVLESLGSVTHISFGSESGDIKALQTLANNLKEKSFDISDIINELIRDGYSYPKSREIAYNDIFPNSDEINLLKNKNDSLALEYLLNCEGIDPIAIKRCDNLSASDIRNLIRDKKSLDKHVPNNILNLINDNKAVSIEDCFKLLKYKVLSMKSDEIEECPSAGEGLGNKIIKEISNASSVDDLITRVKSKRYTYTRISRLCMQILLDIRRTEFSMEKPEYLRILAFNDAGKKLINQAKKEEKLKLPIISNISKNANTLNENGKKMLKLDVKSTDIYNLIANNSKDLKSDYEMHPIGL